MARGHSAKPVLAFCLPFILAFSFLAISAFFVSAFTQELSSQISRSLKIPLFLENVSLSLSKGIVVSKLKLTDKQGRQYFIGQVSLQASPRDIFKKKITIRSIELNEVTVDRVESQYFLNPALLLSSIPTGSQMMWNGFTVTFEKAAIFVQRLSFYVDTPDHSAGKRVIVFDLRIQPSHRSCVLTGKIYPAESSFLTQFKILKSAGILGRTMTFHLDVESLEKDLFINQFKMAAGPFVLQASGIVRHVQSGPDMDLHFYFDPIRLQELAILRSLRPQGGDIGMMGTLKGSLKDYVLGAEAVLPSAVFSLEGESLELDHFSAKLQYRSKDNELKVTEFKGTLDDNLILRVSGQINNFSLPSINLQCRLEHKKNPQEPSEPKSFFVSLSSQGPQNNLELRWSGQSDYTCLIKNISIENEKNAGPGNFFFKAQSAQLLTQYISAQKEKLQQAFLFNDAVLKGRARGKKTFIDELSLKGYGGELFLKGDIHFARDAARYHLLCLLKDLNFQDIKLFYPLFCQVSGLFKGYVVMQKDKDEYLKGLMTADGFKVSHLEFLDKIADFIGIESVKKIENGQLATEFLFSPKICTIDRFDLDNADLKLRTNIQMNPSRLIEATAALSLPRRLLMESKTFKTLLSMARERGDEFDFIVRVNGYLGGLRAELIKSELRDKLQERISVGVQRYIEQEANKALKEESSKF